MQPLTLMEHDGNHVLQLVAGTTLVDDAVRDIGHEPNGYFWEGVAEYLSQTDSRDLLSGVDLDCEGGTFRALASQREPLEVLRALMAPFVNDPNKIRPLVEAAEAQGFAFDD